MSDDWILPVRSRDADGMIQRYWKMGFGDQPGARVIDLRALNALLAVAKAAVDGGGCLICHREVHPSNETTYPCSIAVLDAQHPGWREWQP